MLDNQTDSGIIEEGLPAFLAESRDGETKIISNKKNMKKWYLSKTIWFAILTGALGITTAFQSQYGDLPYLLIATSCIQVVLRLLTKTAIE